jgi:hypothetical protein
MHELKIQLQNFIPGQELKNETKRNCIFLETNRNEKYLRKRETKKNETIFKETKLNKKIIPFHTKKKLTKND